VAGRLSANYAGQHSAVIRDSDASVLDRELEDTTHDSSGSRIRCPLCGWSPRKEYPFDDISFARKTQPTTFLVESIAWQLRIATDPVPPSTEGLSNAWELATLGRT
jgi:hypothetical protein